MSATASTMPATPTRLDGYVLAGVRAELPIGERFAIYGRVDNLFDERYRRRARLRHARPRGLWRRAVAVRLRRGAILLASGAGGLRAAAAGAATGGIVSTNPCADAMLVALVPPERIAAISHYSQDPAATSIPLDVARRFRGDGGDGGGSHRAASPIWCCASSFTPAATLRGLSRGRGCKTLLLDSPTTIAASEAQVRADRRRRSVRAASGRGADRRGSTRRSRAARAERRRGRPAALLYHRRRSRQRAARRCSTR